MQVFQLQVQQRPSSRRRVLPEGGSQMIAPSAPLPCHLSCPHQWQRQELQRKAQNLLRPVLRTTEQYQPLALRTTEQYLQLVPQRQSPFLPSLWLWLLVLRRQAQFLRQE